MKQQQGGGFLDDLSCSGSEEDNSEGEEEREVEEGASKDSMSSPDASVVKKRQKLTRGTRAKAILYDRNPVRDDNGLKSQILNCMVDNHLQFYNPEERGAEITQLKLLVDFFTTKE